LVPKCRVAGSVGVTSIGEPRNQITIEDQRIGDGGHVRN
jgi:hypothetical protein